MNPHTFVQQDYANYVCKDGSCLGILIECLQKPEEFARARGNFTAAGINGGHDSGLFAE